MFKLKKITAKQLTALLTDHMYVLLLLPLIFIALPMWSPGVIMYGDFPLLETSLYSEKFLSTWIDFGSHHGFETLARYPIITIGVLLNSLTIGGEIISKFLILLGFFTASFSFYFSWVILFRNKLSTHDVFFKLSAIMGALFYAYNVWSFHRIHHWYLWLGYAALPLFVVLLIKSFRNPTKWKYAVATVMIWTIASSTPHMVIFYGIFYVGISLYFIIRHVSNKGELLRIVIPLTSIISFYLLLNLFWIYPYTLYTLYSGQGSLLPSILVTEELTQILSRDNVFFNVLRLIQDWWDPRIIDVTPPQSSILYHVWLAASFVPPVLVFTSLILKRNSKIVLFFLAIAIIGILLTLGTNAPFNLYSLILFESPLFTALKYVFRDPDKWAFMIGIGYSFLLSISVFEILKKVNRSKYKYRALMSCAFVSVVLVSFLIYSYPTYNSTAQKVFDSVTIPSEYNQLNTFLQNKPIERVFFMFQDFGPTIWHRQGEFYGFEQRYSDKPNIMAYQYLPISENYHDYIQNSILLNKTSNVSNLIYPLGTSYLIYSNDELNQNNSKLKLLSMSGDIKKLTNIGFINVYKVGNKDVGEFNIPRQKILVSGGLNLFNSLDSLPSFTTLNSSLIFLDQGLNKEQKYRAMNFGDYLALEKGGDDLILSFLDEKYILKPFEFTNHGDPSKMWSKDSALDIIHGQFHPYSKKLGVENWDFDYGQGLVMTDSVGANLSIPIDKINGRNTIDTNNSKLYLFFRYLQNQKGGQINIYLDDKLLNSIDTLNKKSNNFVWENIGSVTLTEGKHNLVLENTAGFNAVNLIAVVSTEQLEKLRSETMKTLGNKSSIFYPMEAETQFYNDNGIDVSSIVLFKDNKSSVSNVANNTEKTFSGQFKAPANSDYVVLGFLTENVSKNDVKSLIKDIKISPSSNSLNKFSSDFEKEENYLLLSDFDSDKGLLPEKFGAFNWTNNQKDILSTSLETEGNKKNYGNESLKVDIKQGNFSYWGTISTDFIPINENTPYGLSLDVSAKNVNQLHSKVYYFNSSKQELENELIFGGRDGTFNNAFSNTALSPSGAKYLKLQLWVAPNPKMNSSYLLDNVKIEELKGLDWTNNQKDILSTSLETEGNKKNYGNESLKVDIKQGNFSYWGTISTDFIPINENTPYGLSLDVSAKNVNQLHSKVYYFNSSKQELENELIFGGRDGTFNNAFSNTALSPSGAKYLKLQLWVAPNPKMNSSYLLDNVKIEELKGLDWTNNQKDILSTSLETEGNKKNYGNESLKVDIKQGNFSYWGTISTDFIPISDNAFYDYKFEVSAKDVNKLHSKVYYYDSLKRELSEDFAFDERSGSFEFSGKKSLLPPSGANYLKLQFWVAPNLMMNSSYFIDNVNLEEIIPISDLKRDGNFTKLKNNYVAIDNHMIQDNNDILTVTSGIYNSNYPNNIKGSRTESVNHRYSNDYKISTRLLPIQDNHIYNYTITYRPENVSSVSTVATFKSSQDVIVNATKYGGKASNGMVISLAPGSKIHSKLDIIRPSNYTIALRAKTCETCTYLITNLTTEDNNKRINTNNVESNISLAGNGSELKWLFSNSSFFLKEGSYELEIYSNSQTDLDSVIVYDIGNVDTLGKTKKTDNGNIFNPRVSISPTVSEHSKLSSTKYNLVIKNATEPYMLTFSESYDPQWVAYLNKDHTNESSVNKDNFKTGSFPLYSIVNGFYINKTGSYTLTVEYQPQEWFIQAGTASLIVLISALGILLLISYLKNLKIKRN